MTFLSISESLRLLLVPGLASPFCTQIERIPVTRAKLNLDGATLTLTPRALTVTQQPCEMIVVQILKSAQRLAHTSVFDWNTR